MKLPLRWILAVLCPSAIGAPARTRAADPLAMPLVALGAISGNTVPIWVAKEQGFFRKYGFDPQQLFIIAGRAAQAMLAGEVSIGIIGSTHVVNPKPSQLRPGDIVDLSLCKKLDESGFFAQPLSGTSRLSGAI